MNLVALEIRYADADRPLVEVRIGHEWLPGEVLHSVHTGSEWSLQVVYPVFGTQQLGTFPANRVRALGFTVGELEGHAAGRIEE